MRGEAGGITLSDFKLYHKVIIIKTVWYWQKKNADTQTSGAELRVQKETHSICENNFQERSQKYTMEKSSSINGVVKIGKPLEKNETRLLFIPIYKY